MNQVGDGFSFTRNAPKTLSRNLMLYRFGGNWNVAQPDGEATHLLASSVFNDEKHVLCWQDSNLCPVHACPPLL